MLILTPEVTVSSLRNGKRERSTWNWWFNYRTDERFFFVVCVCVCVHLVAMAKKKNPQARSRQPSAATLPPGSIRFPGVQSKLRVTPDLLTSAVSALIKTESTQCAPRSFTPVHTIFALSAFTTHVPVVTYVEAHMVGTMVTQNHWEAEHFVTFDFYPQLLNLAPYSRGVCWPVCEGRAVRCEKQEMSIQIGISPDSRPFRSTARVKTTPLHISCREGRQKGAGRV